MKTGFRLAIACVLASALPGCVTPRREQVGADKSLAEAWRIISSKQFVDLTHSFSPTTTVWEGFGPATFAPATDPATGRPYTIEKEGFRTFQYTLVGQYGTHIDPSAHFAADGKTLDELPVKQMVLPLVVFDITPKLGKDPNH